MPIRPGGLSRLRGYGDITPTLAEAFVGAFSIALFRVVFVKRMTR